MNIVEAIKSGKKFKRRHYDWLYVDEDNSIMWFYEDGTKHKFNVEVTDILSDDWEIEEEKIEITYTKLEATLYEAVLNITPGDIEVIWRDLKGVV